LEQFARPNSETWSSAPAALEPPRDQVHLWRVLLDLSPADYCCLAPDEQTRAGKLVHLQHRNRFVAMRSAVRSVLGRYLEISPESRAFRYGEKGKPSLVPEQNGLDLRFNVSHSGSLGILAVACGRELGVDVETRQNIFDYMAIARRFFSPREYDGLAEVPEELRQRAFLRCWTRKEAFVKALGAGLSCSLASFSVSVSPQVSDDVLLEAACQGVYHVSDVALPDECVSALALEGGHLPRCYWTYQP
jgi:4'-phosphopantetheinyl transferase